MTKSEAVNFAHDVKMLIEALVDEGYCKGEAQEFVEQLFIATARKNTTLF